jgi:hypothetical protein
MPVADQDDDEIAARLVAFLEAHDQTPREGARQRERINYRRRVEIILIGQSGQPRVTGHTRNLSTGGLGFLTRRTFAVGERFVALLALGGGAGKFALCRTTFCRYLSEGMHEVGAAFEATAPRINNHRIPSNWIATARTRSTASAPTT